MCVCVHVCACVRACVCVCIYTNKEYRKYTQINLEFLVKLGILKLCLKYFVIGFIPAAIQYKFNPVAVDVRNWTVLLGHPWYSGSVLDWWSTGRVINPAPGA